MHNIANFEIIEEIALHPLDVRPGDTGRCGAVFHAHGQGLVGDLCHDGRMPVAAQVDITGHFERAQSFAPGRFIPQQIGQHSFFRSTPQPTAAVIFLQGRTQGFRRFQLHFLVDGRAHRKAASEKFAFAEILGQLAADFIGEVIARRHGQAKAVKVAVLNGAQRHRDLGLIGGLIDIAVFLHFLQHEVPPRLQPVLAAHRVIIGRSLGQRGKECRFVRGQIGQRLVEIRLRGGGHTIGILAEEDLVHVEFEDLFFVQRFFQTSGKDDFLDLAFCAPVA